MNKKRGFTLVELLVVIAIIGLLSTLAFISLNSARAKARDAKRVSDVRQIQSALELYYNDQSTPSYPAVEDLTAYTTALEGPLDTDEVTLPEAPTSDCDTDTYDTWTYGSDYMYSAPATADVADDYSILFCLNGATGGLEAGIRTATPAGIE